MKLRDTKPRECFRFKHARSIGVKQSQSNNHFGYKLKLSRRKPKEKISSSPRASRRPRHAGILESVSVGWFSQSAERLTVLARWTVSSTFLCSVRLREGRITIGDSCGLEVHFVIHSWMQRSNMLLKAIKNRKIWNSNRSPRLTQE